MLGATFLSGVAAQRPRADRRDQVLHLEAGLVGRAAVVVLAEALQRRLELCLAAVLAGVRLGHDGRAVARLEVLGVVLGPGERRDLEDPGLLGRERHAVAEQAGEMLLAAPERRGLRTGGRGRGERAHGAEEVAEHAVGRPAQQRDRPAGTAGAHELVGRGLVVRGEHHADGGHHDVEGRIVEREVLRIGLDPVELGARGARADAPGVEQLGGEIARHDLGAALRGRDRGVAGAGADVEDALPGLDAARLDEAGAERREERLDHRRVVAGRPHAAVACLQLDVGGCGRRAAADLGLVTFAIMPPWLGGEEYGHAPRRTSGGVQLGEHGGDVVVDGLRRDDEPPTIFEFVSTLGEQRQDVELPAASGRRPGAASRGHGPACGCGAARRGARSRSRSRPEADEPRRARRRTAERGARRRPRSFSMAGHLERPRTRS